MRPQKYPQHQGVLILGQLFCKPPGQTAPPPRPGEFRRGDSSPVSRPDCSKFPGGSRFYFQGRPILQDRLRDVVLQGEDDGQLMMGLGKLGRQAQGLGIFGARVIQPALHGQGLAQAHMGLRVGMFLSPTSRNTEPRPRPANSGAAPPFPIEMDIPQGRVKPERLSAIQRPLHGPLPSSREMLPST